MLIALVCLGMCFHADTVQAQPRNASHTVRVEVPAIHAMMVSSRSVDLRPTVADVVIGASQVTMTDDSSQLLWITNGRDMKITVQSNLSSPRFNMTLQAVNPSAGVAAPPALVSTAPTDFLLDIGRSAGRCTIRYTVIAAPEAGTGTEYHEITFTMTDL